MFLEIQDNFTKQVKKDLNKIQNNVIRQSIVTSLNATINKTKTTANKQIRNIANIKVSKINQALKPRKANKYNLSADIDTSERKALNLINHVSGDLTRFRRRKQKTGNNRFTKTASKGVRAKPYTKNVYHKGTFLARGKNNNLLVFKRKGSTRKAKLEVVYGASIRDIFQRVRTKKAMTNRVNNEIEKEFKRAFKFHVNKAISK